MTKIKASTLSVITQDSKSVFCGLEVDGNYINITLRFDREKPMLCGYPTDWVLHDELDPYSEDSLTYAESPEHIPEECSVYVSAKDEEAIIRQLFKAIKKQFQDPDWAGHIDDKRRNEILNMFKKS